MKKIFLLILIFIIPIYTYLDYNNNINQFLKESKKIEVIQGDNIIKVLTRELWYNEIYLKIYKKLNPEIFEFKLEKWEYYLQNWVWIKEILNTIKSWSITPTRVITILPWWNIYDIDEYLTKQKLINSWEFIQKTNIINDELKKDFYFLNTVSTLEWYIYPDTYSINPTNFSIDKFISTTLKNLDKKLKDNKLYTYTDLDKIINIASIVEKEEKNSQEKPIVAWILIKRLEENWMLWADATACYSYKLTSNECKMTLSSYIYQKNDYNTRMMTWLPKTPIANPSIDTILSVINYKKSPYYYYLHDISNWQIYYAKTLEEHNINKSKYIK